MADKGTQNSTVPIFYPLFLEHERRWKNSGKSCRCAEGFEGDNCDKIVFCKNGEFANGRCICAEGWKGELCERKCIPNQT